MTPPSPLYTLPPCLIAELCDLLDISSLGPLRLVSKYFKAIFDASFLNLFQHRTIELSKTSLEMLPLLGSSPCLEAGLRHLTLTCVLYESRDITLHGNAVAKHLRLPKWKEKAEAEKKRLRPLDLSIEADQLWMEMKQLEQHNFSGEDMCKMLTAGLRKMRSLETITLTARIVGPDRRNYRLPEDVNYFHWRDLWVHSIQAYRVVMSAIAQSQVGITGLHIYRGLKLCGVPTDEAGMPLERLEAEGFAAVARRLKSFSIRLTSVVDPIRPKDSTTMDSGFYDRFDISRGRDLGAADQQLIKRESDPSGLARLLHLMPNLESLDLHFFTRIRERLDGAASYREFLPTVFRDLRFPQLKNLDLAGFLATEESMRCIIRDHPDLQTLSLRHLHLTDRSWEPVFSVLAQTRYLTRLYLADLHSPGVRLLVEFKIAYMNLGPPNSDDERFPGLDGDTVWEMRTIGPDEFRCGLSFPSQELSIYQSREQWAWMIYWSLDFGPKLRI